MKLGSKNTPAAYTQEGGDVVNNELLDNVGDGPADMVGDNNGYSGLEGEDLLDDTDMQVDDDQRLNTSLGWQDEGGAMALTVPIRCVSML